MEGNKKINQSQPSSAPIRKQDGSWARSDDEKAWTFTNHLSEVFIPFVEGDSQTARGDITTQNIINQSRLPIAEFKIKDIRKVILKMDSNKAPGYDLIIAKLLKELPSIGVKFMKFIYNAILRNSFVSPQWKVTKVIVI